MTSMFAVIYKFKIKSGMEWKFQEAWSTMTHEFLNIHGGLGSCLHKDDDGNFLAYARWPNRQLWEANKTIINVAAMKDMKDCIEQSSPPIPLECVKDLLKRG